MKCTPLPLVATLLVAACGNSGTGIPDGDGGTGGGVDACVGLQCQQNFHCPGGGKTRLLGTVYTPAGNLPLPNIRVFVPNTALADFPTQLTCDRCDADVSGSPVTSVFTGVDGTFALEDVPSGANIPLVVQSGRWRMQFTIPSITDCTDNTVPVNMTIRLPRTQKRGATGEGDIPRIALTAGSADALECLFRKMGIDDTEITTQGGTGRVQLLASNGSNQFAPTFNGGGMFVDAYNWWGNNANAADDVAAIAARLSQYDIIIHSCEGAEFCTGAGGRCTAGTYPTNKPMKALQALKYYADHNGRVFMSHYHHTWMEYNPDATWSGLLNWTSSNHAGSLADRNCNMSDHSDCATIDMTFAKARNLATWLTNPFVCGLGTSTACTAANGSPSLGFMRETTVRNSANGFVTAMGKERWIYLDTGTPTQFVASDTPVDALPANQCGKIVFSDVHVSAGSTSRPGSGTCPASTGSTCPNNTCNTTCCPAPAVCNGNACNFGPTQGCPYPTGCSATITPQEKALIFMMFDIAACVGPVIGKPAP